MDVHNDQLLSVSQSHIPNPNPFSRIFKNKEMLIFRSWVAVQCLRIDMHDGQLLSVQPGAITPLRVWAGPKICLNFRKDIVGKNLLQIWTEMTRFQPSSCTCTWANSRSNVRKCGAFFPPEKQVLKNSHGRRFLGPGNGKKVGQLVLVPLKQDKHCKVGWTQNCTNLLF